MLISVALKFQARPSNITILFPHLYAFAAGGKKEGGNIFYYYSVVYPTKWKGYGFIIYGPQRNIAGK